MKIHSLRNFPDAGLLWRALRVFFIAAFPLLMAAMTSSCGFGDDDDEPDVPEEPAPASAGRAVLVYMVANNSLGSQYIDADLKGYDNADIQEMLTGAANGALGNNRLILYHHAYRTDPVLVEVTRDGLREIKAYDTEDNSVTYARMKEVIADFKAEAPAERYGIVLWSHASGWEQNGIADDGVPAQMLKAYGVDGSKQMNVTTLARVLEGEAFDYVYFDCCHMAGVEVAYELRGVTDKIVGSVTELPAAGMPYDLTLPFLMADNAMPEEAAAETFRYYDAMSGYGRTCTMSVIDTSRLDELASAVRELYETHPVLPSAYRPQKFIYSNCVFYDLEHYMKGLCDGNPGREELLDRALAAIDNAVIYRASTPKIWEGLRNEVTIESHCGLSTFIMNGSADAQRYNYCDLQWYDDVAGYLFP